MTRVAVVAVSEELRARVAAALRADASFEVVSTAASLDDVGPAVDVVLVARTTRAMRAHVGDGTPLRGRAAEAAALTNREREILALLADGLGNKQIAARLGITPNTVKTHLELLFEKLGVSTRAEAVAAGVRGGLLLL